MGFNVVVLAQKPKTQTLIVDSDLDMGQYDVMATNVIGDTAEFSEFVGGVGNFSNVLGSGNLDIEGTGNIKGLTTFQNGVQVNGALNVEGSINNVNIASNGEITTAQGVNGADFNGAKITSTKFNGATIDTSGNVTGAKGTFSGAVTGANFNGVTIRTGTLTVTPSSGLVVLPAHQETSSSGQFHGGTTLLPYTPNVSYTGSIKFRGGTSNGILILYTSKKSEGETVSINASTDYTYTFSGIRYLYANTVYSNHPVSFYNFTIT